MALSIIGPIGLSSRTPCFKQEYNSPMLTEFEPVHGLKIPVNDPVLHIFSNAAFADSKCFFSVFFNSSGIYIRIVLTLPVANANYPAFITGPLCGS